MFTANRNERSSRITLFRVSIRNLFTTSLSIDFFEGFVSFYLKIDKIDRSCKRNSIIRMFG